jgi:hypothetical protein
MGRILSSTARVSLSMGSSHNRVSSARYNGAAVVKGAWA